MGLEHKESNYYNEINVMRGFLALLVVIGHVTAQIERDNSLTSFILYAIGTVIYSFHMALFFPISGFVSVKLINCTDMIQKVRYTWQRFMRLLVPYLVMGCIYLPFRIILTKIARTEYALNDFWKILIGVNPDGALWFLYVLFLVTMIGCWFVNKKHLVLTIAIAFCLCIFSLIFEFHLTLERLLYFSPFYFGGVFVRLNYEKIVTIFQ